MGASSALAVLARNPGEAYALTWVDQSALESLAAAGEETGPAERLVAAAMGLNVDLAFVPSDEAWAQAAVRALRQADIASAWVVTGVLGATADELGWIDALRRSAGSPGSLAFPLDHALAASSEAVRRGVTAEADVLVVADDLAGAGGWLVAPDFALEALVPCYRHLVRQWYPARPAIFHSDGDVRALFPALARSGFSAVHFGQLEPEKRAAVALAVSDAGMVPVGGVETRRLLTGRAADDYGLVAATLGVRPHVVADDGGITTPAEMSAFATALDQIRERRSSQ